MKQQRLRRGMTQQDLAERCAEAGVPVDESQVSRIERGVYTPRPRLRAVMAQILDLDVDEFERADDTATAVSSSAGSPA
ncbi:helix-turn-helix transcriptional regulator [Streptomyces sp. NPDC006997]|uniref:helix-turn-helix transcriptional regulator n=1 Tax=Streptomyces sp. NPDC006997 TaxID=3155356 RepID=UPI0033EB8265